MHYFFIIFLNLLLTKKKFVYHFQKCRSSSIFKKCRSSFVFLTIRSSSISKTIEVDFHFQKLRSSSIYKKLRSSSIFKKIIGGLPFIFYMVLYRNSTYWLYTGILEFKPFKAFYRECSIYIWGCSMYIDYLCVSSNLGGGGSKFGCKLDK